MISEILHRIQGGDMVAFGDLYDTSYRRIYSFVYHRTLSHETTEEITSDVYFKALKKIHTFRGSDERSWYAWIYTIAYRCISDHYRNTHETSSLEETDIGYETGIEKSARDESRLQEVLKFMDTLTTKERHFLTLRIWDELSYAEISEITGESIANAKKIVSRTLIKISANISLFFIFSFFLYVTTH